MILRKLGLYKLYKRSGQEHFHKSHFLRTERGLKKMAAALQQRVPVPENSSWRHAQTPDTVPPHELITRAFLSP